MFEIFKKFKISVEKENGYFLKSIKSNRGGEFTSKDFVAFYEEQGFRHSLTIPYSPQQNGVAERKNRTILNMERSMMKQKQIPKAFCAEAVDCVVYILNRSLTRSLWNMTPQEAWSRQKPGVGHLRVFGSIAYAHVPKQRRTKLDDRSAEFVLML